jgi:hypothetical protein
MEQRAPRLGRESFELPGRVDLPREEGGEVLGHRRVRCVRKTDLRQRCAGACGGARVGRHSREVTLHERRGHFVARELGAQSAADQLRPARRDGDWRRGHLVITEQPLFRTAASVRERGHLPAVDLLAFRFELRLHDVGEREIHVVAAEQDVVPHGHAGQLQRAPLVERSNRRKVSGTAADVHHENDVPWPHLRAPPIAHRIDPGVQRRLGLFEQREALDPRGHRRLHGQLARARIERRGHGENDVLRAERARCVAARHARFPCFTQVLQVAP